jgi:phytoene dehydrogenase-like protein
VAGLRILQASPPGPAADCELRTANCELRTDFTRIITDLDIYFVYKNLLKALPFPEKWFRHERSTSALIFYWGMKMQSEMLDMHNILFAEDYRQEFRCLFDLKVMHADPTIYIFVSSKVVRDDAPEGCENWFVMVNTPPDEGQDWAKIIEDTRLKIEDKIGRLLKIDVRKHRLFEFVLDPRDIERKTASFRGSLYGNSSNSAFAAFRRHPNFSRIKGLYHVGGSVHPGGGIPLCLSSAKIAAELIIKHTKP